jgi:hypothetical protein
MMFIFVESVDLLWPDLLALKLEQDFPGVRLAGPKDYDWGLREIHIIDPSGVLWHIANG